MVEPEKTSLAPLFLEGVAIQSPAAGPVSRPLYSGEPRWVRLPSPIRQRLAISAAALPLQRFAKRTIDIALSLGGLALLSPALLLISLLIKHDSEGPAFFSQTRVGKAGRLFRLYKFRTMVANAESLKKELLALNEIDGPAFKIKKDPRITRIGAFLRRTSLDELPQLWNVLIGDMSLVGPRPALPAEVPHWEDWQFDRLSVEQGCTCIWQVSGRSHTSFQDWMAMDIEYAKSWTIGRDLQLIAKTVVVMFNGRGAY